jgi:uncharacterized protein YecT (DUF1311 family)
MAKRLSILVALTVLLGPRSLSAQAPKTFAECNKNATTTEALQVCADQALERSETARKSAYASVLKAVKNEQNGVKRVEEAEAAWGRYRDAYVEARYPATNKAHYGSRFTINLILLKARLNNDHAADLKLLTERE